MFGRKELDKLVSQSHNSIDPEQQPLLFNSSSTENINNNNESESTQYSTTSLPTKLKTETLVVQSSNIILPDDFVFKCNSISVDKIGSTFDPPKHYNTIPGKPNNEKTSEITLVTVNRSNLEKARLVFEFLATLVLTIVTFAAFFIPSINGEWTSYTPGPSKSSTPSHPTKTTFYGGGSSALIALCVFWAYTFALISARLYIINRTNPATTITSLPISLWKQSTVLYVFGLCCNTVSCRSSLLYPYSAPSRAFNITQFVLALLLFFNNFSAQIGDKKPLLYVKDNLFPSPEPVSSLFSMATFGWLNPIIRKGYYKTLVFADIWETSLDFHSELVLNTFQQRFKLQRQKDNGRSFLASLFSFFSGPILIANGWAAANGLLGFLPSVFLKRILEYIDNPRNSPRSMVWIYVFSLLLCGVAKNVTFGQYIYLSKKLSIQMKSILIGEVYLKTLRSREVSQQQCEEADEKDEKNEKKKKESDNQENSQSNQGAIINLMAVDTTQASDIFNYMYALTIGVISPVICVTFLYSFLGWSSFVGATAMICSIPFQYKISTQYARYQNQFMEASDRRINKLNEVLQSIRIIKYFAWEDNFKSQIFKVRDEELRLLFKKGLMWSMSIFAYLFIPIFVVVLTFSTFIFVQKETLTAPVAFTALAILNLMRDNLDELADSLTDILQSHVSFERIVSFLNEPETSKCQQLQRNVTSSSPFSSRIGIENGTFSWETGTLAQSSVKDFKLRDINVEFELGKLNVIVGPTGSGKTSLLLALLGEMELLKGSVYLPGSQFRDRVVPNKLTGLAETVAYCSQTPWLLNDTIKNNILFGAKFNEKRYKHVLAACSLERDLEILEAGDQTEIGERGITLSGGQKQRVSLARAFYSNSRHLILDDCLSAVDSHTGKWIYKHCLVGPTAKARTIILVSHNVSLVVAQAAKVVVLENGRVVAQDTPKSLLTQGLIEYDDSGSSTPEQNVAQSEYHIQKPHEPLVSEYIDVEEPEAAVTIEPDADILEEEEEEEQKNFGQLVKAESTSVGHVSFDVYIAYFKAIGGIKFWSILVFLFVARPVLEIGLSYWVRIWTKAITKPEPSPVNVYTFEYNTHIFNKSEYKNSFFSSLFHYYAFEIQSTQLFNSLDATTQKSAFYMLIYIVIGVAFAAFSSLNSVVNTIGGIHASRTMFEKLLSSVMNAKIRFFDSTPIGRIMNRFSKDIGGIDQRLANTCAGVMRNVFGGLSTIILISTITPSFLFVACVIMGIYYIICLFFLSASRELKRLDSISRSPIYQHFGETLAGVCTIRAYGVGDRFAHDNFEKLDTNNRAFYYQWCTNRWLMFRLELTNSVVAFSAAVLLILGMNKIDAGLAGLSLSFAMNFSVYVWRTVRLYANMEMSMNSVERVIEYLDIDKEADSIVASSRPPVNWPSRGEIEVKDLSLRYAPELPLVIKNVSFKVPAFNKVGIVGRTGAGKSTIITAFFRFLEAESGYIKIDGVDISKIGLKDLRQNLSIIPQDPTLFQGTIRSNLDPFEQYSDKDIFEALCRVHLINRVELQKRGDAKNTVNSAAISSYLLTNENVNLFYDLSTPVSEGGTNFSQGQRQLMCLARSLLKAPKVLLLDEATASIDYESDEQVQKTIREEFEHTTTILTIAHRLRSIIDYDKILVMDAGQVAEYDHPFKLLENKESIFYSMCANSGELETLVSIATDSYNKNH